MRNRILLCILKLRLKLYKRDAKYYDNIGCFNNWYHEHGIPELEKRIKELE
jgi:hypothetical protein